MRARVVAIGWCIAFLLAGTSAIPRQGDDARGLSPSEQRLLRQCVTAFEAARVSATEIPQLATAGKGALHRTLAPLARKLPYGSRDSISVAFVLCFLGSDREANLARMVVPYTRWRRGMSDAGLDLELLPRALSAIYSHNRDAAVAQYLLDMRGDGAFAETLSVARAGLFERYPESLLRVAASRDSRLLNLARDLLFASWEEARAIRIRRQLARIASESHGGARRGARFCREFLSKELPRWRSRYGRGP